MMDTPKNKSNTDNLQFITWRDRYSAWMKIVDSPLPEQPLPSGFIDSLRAANPYKNHTDTHGKSWGIIWNKCCDKAEQLLNQTEEAK